MARRGRLSASLFHANGPEVLDCDGLRGKTLPRRERVVVTVPRACIGNPRWIRFGASMGRETNTHHFLDDARIDAGFLSGRCGSDRGSATTDGSVQARRESSIRSSSWARSASRCRRGTSRIGPVP